jgi:uncharacterized protein (DUF433 family)
MIETLHERIICDPDIKLCKPIVKGARITVELLLENLGYGMSVEELLEAYPHLEREDVLAGLRFAADVVTLSDTLQPERAV